MINKDKQGSLGHSLKPVQSFSSIVLQSSKQLTLLTCTFSGLNPVIASRFHDTYIHAYNIHANVIKKYIIIRDNNINLLFISYILHVIYMTVRVRASVIFHISCYI